MFTFWFAIISEVSFDALELPREEQIWRALAAARGKKNAIPASYSTRQKGEREREESASLNLFWVRMTA